MNNQVGGSNRGRPANRHRGLPDIALPFDPNTLQANAIRFGLSPRDAAHFAQVTMQHFHIAQANQPTEPITSNQLTETVRAYNRAMDNRLQATEQQLRESGAEIDELEDESVKSEDEAEDTVKERRVSVETIVVHGQRRKKYKFSQEALDDYFGGEDPYKEKIEEPEIKKEDPDEPKHDIITALCSNIELAVELGKHLRPKDVISLYCTNRAFHNAVKGHLLSSVRMWISYNAPEAGSIFNFRYYKRHLTEDPMGRTYSEMAEGLPERLQPPPMKRDAVRTIPGFKYFQLVVGRDRFCHDIIAIMARNGHRMPPTMHSTLLRLWLFMDVATTSGRQAMIHSTTRWRDIDLYNAQFFFVKLAMHFNDPIFGTPSLDLLQLMLGQQGLYPLWQLLAGKNYTTLREILRLKARYDLDFPMHRWNHLTESVYGCPYEEIGSTHLEGWGTGTRHLVRADELVPQEAVRRGLQLCQHIRYMALWGYFDWYTEQNLVPTEEELYIEDEENVTETMDTTYHWKPKHALKKRWTTLTEEQRQEIIEDEDDDRLRALAFTQDNDEYDSNEYDEDEYSINSSALEEYLDFDNDEAMSPAAASDIMMPDVLSAETGTELPERHDPSETTVDSAPSSLSYNLENEINCGYILAPCDKDQLSVVPAKDDKEAWVSFIDDAFLDMPMEMDEDYALRAQAWQDYKPSELAEEAPWERAIREAAANLVGRS